MIQAVQMVRAPLERFYSTLSEGRRRAFPPWPSSRTVVRPPPAAWRRSATRAATSFAQLPVDRNRTGAPTHPAQEAAFETLKAVSAGAAAGLEASCRRRRRKTPVERIDAVERRLDGMVQAAKEVRPALAAFYATLSDEQKARFNLPASSANAANL